MVVDVVADIVNGIVYRDVGNSPGARWVYQKKSASEKMSVPILSKDPQGQEKIRYFR